MTYAELDSSLSQAQGHAYHLCGSPRPPDPVLPPGPAAAGSSGCVQCSGTGNGYSIGWQWRCSGREGIVNGRRWRWCRNTQERQLRASAVVRARLGEAQSGLGHGLTTGRARLVEPRARATELAVRAQ